MPKHELDFKKRYHYSRLSSDEDRRLYRFMVDCIQARRLRFFYASRFVAAVIPEEYRDYPLLLHNEEVEAANLGLVYDAILWDFPEFFYINADELVVYQNTGVIDMSLPLSPYSETAIRRIERELDRIYHEFDGVESGFPLELSVNDYIIRHYTYDHLGEHYHGRKKQEIFTVAGLIKRGSGVCAAITRLAQYILQRRGMEVSVLFSDPEEKNAKAHCWLAVKLRGDYYHLDITANMNYAEAPYSIQYLCFNITDKEMLEERPDYRPEQHPAIRCHARRENYYRAAGLYFGKEEEITAAMRRFIEENREKTGPVYFYFRVPRRFPEKRVRPAMQAAIRGVPRKSCAYLNANGYYAVEFIFRE